VSSTEGIRANTLHREVRFNRLLTPSLPIFGALNHRFKPAGYASADEFPCTNILFYISKQRRIGFINEGLLRPAETLIVRAINSFRFAGNYFRENINRNVCNDSGKKDKAVRRNQDRSLLYFIADASVQDIAKVLISRLEIFKL